MINADQFRVEIVQKALDKLGLYSKSAEILLMLTCAQETLGCTYIKQIEGPALGAFQMEPKTHEDMWATFLPRRSDLTYKLLSTVYLNSKPPVEFLEYNLLYAAMMCRLKYFFVKEPLPPEDDLKAIAQYYKTHWNTVLGSATVDSAITNYNKFIKKPNANKAAA